MSAQQEGGNNSEAPQEERSSLNANTQLNTFINAQIAESAALMKQAGGEKEEIIDLLAKIARGAQSEVSAEQKTQISALKNDGLDARCKWLFDMAHAKNTDVEAFNSVFNLGKDQGFVYYFKDDGTASYRCFSKDGMKNAVAEILQTSSGVDIDLHGKGFFNEESSKLIMGALEADISYTEDIAATVSAVSARGAIANATYDATGAEVSTEGRDGMSGAEGEIAPASESKSATFTFKGANGKDISGTAKELQGFYQLHKANVEGNLAEVLQDKFGVEKKQCKGIQEQFSKGNFTIEKGVIKVGESELKLNEPAPQSAQSTAPAPEEGAGGFEADDWGELYAALDTEAGDDGLYVEMTSPSAANTGPPPRPPMKPEFMAAVAELQGGAATVTTDPAFTAGAYAAMNTEGSRGEAAKERAEAQIATAGKAAHEPNYVTTASSPALGGGSTPN